MANYFRRWNKSESDIDKVARYVYQIRQAEDLRRGVKPRPFLRWLQTPSARSEIINYEALLKANGNKLNIPVNDLYNPTTHELTTLYPLFGERSYIYDLERSLEHSKVHGTPAPEKGTPGLETFTENTSDDDIELDHRILDVIEKKNAEEHEVLLAQKPITHPAKQLEAPAPTLTAAAPVQTTNTQQTAPVASTSTANPEGNQTPVVPNIMAENEQLAAGAGSAASERATVSTVMRQPTSNTSGSYNFRNSFVVNSWAYAYEGMHKDPKNIALLTTPLAVIPANKLSTYMSEAQWEN